MQITRKLAATAVAGLTIAGLALGVAPAANADPANSSNPVLDGFGSDTTQDVMNGLASVITSGGQPVIASYNAGSGLLTATTTPRRPGETTPVDVPRANGSGQGKTALIAAVNGTAVTLNTFASSGPLGRDDVEFARSSSEGTWNAAGQYNYIPFAVDAVTYAEASGGAAPNNIPLGTVVGQDSDADGTLDLTLKNVYSRNATTTLEVGTSGTTVTVGAQGSGAQIVPFIPHPGSGTRSFFQGEIGGTFGSIVRDTFTYSTTATECATNAAITTPAGTFPQFNAGTGVCTAGVQEHNGKVTQRVTNAIVPFSIAQHIAQADATYLNDTYGAGVVDRRFGAVLRSVNGITPTVSGNLNTNFPIRRAVFNIVEHNAITSGQSAYNPTIVSTFVGASSAVQSNATVITDFGFGAIPATGVSITSATNGTNTYLPGDTGYRAN